MTANLPLEPDRHEMEAVGQAALGFVIRFVEERAGAPAADLDGAADRARGLLQPPPATGRPFAELLEEVDGAAAKAIDTAGPGYLAYIPGGGLFAAALAQLVAAATNRYVNIAAFAPACVAMEASVVRWLGDVFGLPAESQGILTSGGSIANFSALVTARTARLGEDFLRGTVYVTEHTHLSVAKAAKLAGFPERNVRVVPCTSNLEMEPDALAAAVAADRAAGLEPFCVVATAGTTNTGAVDPIDAVADLAVEHGLWLHVDAAYGGFFVLTERGRVTLAGIERADSITLDPHKGMFLPYGVGCLLARDGSRLRAAHAVGGQYLQDLDEIAGLPNFADYSPELSRGFRGLQLWLPLHLHGVDAFREALDEKLDLARTVYEELHAEPDLEVPWEPRLSTVAFRLREPDSDERTRQMLARLNAEGRVSLSSTTIDGRFTLRVCVLSHRTHRDRIDEAIASIRRAARD